MNQKCLCFTPDEIVFLSITDFPDKPCNAVYFSIYHKHTESPVLEWESNVCGHYDIWF